MGLRVTARDTPASGGRGRRRGGRGVGGEGGGRQTQDPGTARMDGRWDCEAAAAAVDACSQGSSSYVGTMGVDDGDNDDMTTTTVVVVIMVTAHTSRTSHALI